ncbi:hypothetical protein QR680_012225 [Steinernema hermaphroditum]|uniref:Major facilitator superfamily (MFS) profile domain-containing protein n=1 Tax=Steinernema hermaphroditum TaxID=289476 RepID=A0AA39I1B4_9BILA|nr:hypothetical protein QR680_012225 [Steinernema hermaphroditum]
MAFFERPLIPASRGPPDEMLFNINRFHAFVLVTWQFSIFFASQQIFPIFSNYVPKWRCGESEPFGKNCSAYLACEGKHEFEDIAFHSAALEFDWVCGPRAYLASLFSQIQFAGVLCGTFLYGTLSDCFGRRPIALLALASGIAISFVSGMAPNWLILLITRFFIGLSIGGTIVVVCTFVMEMLLPEQRMALRAFFNWGVARLMVTVICYYFPEWREASIACAIAALPAFLIVLFVFPESPTWLHNKHKMEEMRRSEKKIARIAGIPYVEVDHPKLEKKKGFLSLIKDGRLAKRLFVLWIMWFTASLCGYATDLNSSSISGNLFLNQILFSILIALSKVVLVVFDTLNANFSRRNLHQYAQAVVCTCFFILTMLVMFQYQGVAILVVNLIGTVFIEYTWDACYLCAVEAMPTNMRASSMGSCSLVARIGAIMAPVLPFLNSIWGPSAYLTVVILGLINLVVSYFFLVETKGINLDAVKIHEEDVEEEEEQMDMLKKENGNA